MADDIVTITLRGRENVQAALDDLKDYLPKRLLPTSTKKAALLMLAALQPFIPVFTGRLKRNIVVKARTTAKTVRSRVVVNVGSGRNSPDDAFYWRFLVKGWTDRGGAHHQKDFASSTITGHFAEAAQLVEDSVGKAIDRAEQKARQVF